MQIGQTLSQPLFNNLQAEKETQQAQDTLLRPTRAKSKEPQSSSVGDQEEQTSRETYGLLVLENMSDPEYKAFERATVGMNQSEKMRAAQALYMLNPVGGIAAIDQLNLNDFSQTISANFRQAQKAFGGLASDGYGFLGKYKNALFNSQNPIDIQG